MSAPFALHNYVACMSCKRPFTDANVHTIAGWRETQISGFCEDCFDEITAEPEDDPAPFLGDDEAPF